MFYKNPGNTTIVPAGELGLRNTFSNQDLCILLLLIFRGEMKGT